MRDKEIINIIAEQLRNEFPNQVIDNIIEKSERLYSVMRLKQPLNEINKAKIILKKLLKEL